jgi:hypothetical protein
VFMLGGGNYLEREQLAAWAARSTGAAGGVAGGSLRAVSVDRVTLLDRRHVKTEGIYHVLRGWSHIAVGA